MILTKKCLPPEKELPATFINCVSQKLYARKMFVELNNHFKDSYNEHLIIIIKTIVASYYKIRIFNLAKKIIGTPDSRSSTTNA